jgi:hypothetical protein
MAVFSFLPDPSGIVFVNGKVYTAFSPFTHPLILPPMGATESLMPAEV